MPQDDPFFCRRILPDDGHAVPLLNRNMTASLLLRPLFYRPSHAIFKFEYGLALLILRPPFGILPCCFNPS
jgi:hypothetical protein